MIVPVFPLGCTLMPGGRLPLHVFEDRYRTMMADVLSSGHPEFGVVLIERGNEVGGGEIRGGHGTMARVLQCRAFADGRYAVLAGGTSRFIVERWRDDHPYPSAVVRFAEEPSNGAHVAVDLLSVRAQVRQVNALAAECGSEGADLQVNLLGDAELDSWRLIDASPLGHHDRQRLLALDDIDERCRQFVDLLAEVRESLLATLGTPG